MGNLQTPPRIRNLQRKLYQKAKSEPEYRFYLLYDKVYRPDILRHAYALSKSNGGAPGVDGVTFEDIESGEGVEALLAELGKEVKEETYRPLPVRRVMIPKENGGERPLGIPCIRDRVVQTAAKLVLEPIFEADLPDNAHAYRPKRSAHGAIREVLGALRSGYTDVVDADLAKYFDTIPHDDLLRSVARRISDRKMLRLIKMWLKTPVEERDDQGRRRRTGGKKHRQGIPQGGVISPLLANVYIRRLLICWAQWGLEEKLRARIVNYADDFVIVCRGTAPEALAAARTILGKMGLELSQEKTRVTNAWREPFDFLGYTFGVCHRRDNGRRYLGARPSERARKRLYGRVRHVLHRGNMQPRERVIRQLNQMLIGWSQYFSCDTLTKAYRTLDYQVRQRLRKWLCQRHKVQGRGTRRFPDEWLYGPLGLIRLESLLRSRRSKV